MRRHSICISLALLASYNLCKHLVILTKSLVCCIPTDTEKKVIRFSTHTQTRMLSANRYEIPSDLDDEDDNDRIDESDDAWVHVDDDHEQEQWEMVRQDRNPLPPSNSSFPQWKEDFKVECWNERGECQNVSIPERLRRPVDVRAHLIDACASTHVADGMQTSRPARVRPMAPAMQMCWVSGKSIVRYDRCSFFHSWESVHDRAPLFTSRRALLRWQRTQQPRTQLMTIASVTLYHKPDLTRVKRSRPVRPSSRGKRRLHLEHLHAKPTWVWRPPPVEKLPRGWAGVPPWPLATIIIQVFVFVTYSSLSYGAPRPGRGTLPLFQPRRHTH